MRLNVRLKPEIHKRLQSLADKEGQSISGIVRMLIVQYLEKKEPRYLTVVSVEAADKAEQLETLNAREY